MKRILVMLCAVMMIFTCGACGGEDNPGVDGGNGGDTGDKKGVVNVSIPANAQTEYAWNAMAQAYNNLPENKNKRRVLINANPDAADYTTKLLTSLAGGANNVAADIVVANEAGQYFSTSFVNLNSYLGKKNPYAGDQIWRNTLETPAYQTYGADNALYMLSFDTTQVFFVYKKGVFEENGISVPNNWDEFVEVCDKLSKTQVPGTNETYIPVSFGGNKKSMGMPMSWLMRIYADQYFRDMAETAHSKDGDYSYDPDIDADWDYLPDASSYEGTDAQKMLQAMNNDHPSNYTVNVLRAYDAYFNGRDNAYNPKGARYQDMLNNLFRVFGNPDYLNTDLSVSYDTALTNMYTSRGAMAIVASDFFVAYAQQNSITNIADVFDELGIFYAPAMTAFDKTNPDAAPAADYTRSLGGANGFFGVVNKSKTQTDLAMDFLMYVFSPQGQQVRLNSLAQHKGSLTGPLLVKNVEIPEKLQRPLEVLKEAAGGNTLYGECDNNPIFLTAVGLKSYNGMYEPHVMDEMQSALWSYFIDQSASSVQCGETFYQSMVKYRKDFFQTLGYREDCLSDLNKDPRA